MNERLDESRRFVSTLMSNLPGIVYRCRNDYQWTMEYISEGCEELTGYPPGDLLENRELSYGSLILEPDRESVWRSVQEAIAKRQPFQIEYRINKANGEETWVWERGRGVYSEDGDLLALEGFILDITERKKSRALLAEREKELSHAQKMEAIGEMAGGLAHDLNNLFTAICGFTQLVASTADLDEANQENMRQVRHALDRSSKLVRQLLALSRHQVLEPVVVQLNEVIEDVSELLRRILRDDIELEKVLSDDLWNVYLDSSQLEQILLNLAINAQDAMPEGGRLTIETSNVELDESYTDRKATVEPGAYVHLSVSDTGVGMEPEIRDRIFEPFFTTKERGTGLGLATVYGIVKQSGGHVWVYSEPDRGTTFKLHFPRHEKEPAERRSEVEQASPARTNESERILVVEDEDQIRLLVKTVLKGRGYEVFEAASAKKALELGETSDLTVDLVITDLVLPDMNGQKLIDELRARKVTHRAICMSGYTDGTVHGNKLIDPATAFLPKPFTPTELFAKISEILETDPPE